MSDNLLDGSLLDIPKEKNDLKVQWLDIEDGRYFTDAVEGAIKEGSIMPSRHTLPQLFLSTTQIEKYLQCPRKYELRYVYKYQTPVNAAIIQGSAIHEVLEVVYKLVKIDGEIPEREYVFDTYSSTVSKKLEGQEIDFGDSSPQEFREQGEGLLKKWYEDKLPKVKPVEVEKAFVVSLAGVPLVGMIDLIDEHETLHVVDNKVMGRKPPQTDVDNSLQLTLYYAASQIPNQRLDVFTKTKIPKVVSVSTERTQKDVNWAVYLVHHVATAIEKGSFPPCSPGSWACSRKWCEYWDVCRGGA